MSALLPTQLTLFEVLRLTGTFLGLGIGTSVGFARFGVVGAIIGGIVGLVVGALVGGLPDWLGKRWMFRSIEKSSTAELRAIVAQRDWNFYQTMSLLQLATRGEDVQSDLPRILTMLESDSTLTRVYGWDALRLVYTELAERIADYDPRASTEECRLKTTVLRSKE
jgi:hypothetical protein